MYMPINTSACAYYAIDKEQQQQQQQQKQQ